MSARNFGRVSVALMAFFMVAVFGNWDMQQGGTGFVLFAQAQAADNKDSDDHDDFDHLACYKVKCFDPYTKYQIPCPPEEEYVELFNQFTPSYRGKNYGVKVVVKELDTLCVPTKKHHPKPNNYPPYKDNQD